MTKTPENAARTLGSGGATYAAAGVDIAAGDRAVELMKAKVARATRPEVVGDLGGFAGLFAVDFTRYKKPLLASSTDGVGTKLTIAQAMDKHDTIGQDLVGMVVDDLVVCGAEPLFLLDYIACGQVVPERMAEIVGGVAEGCRIAGCALVGGETAEHPGIMGPDEYDLAGAGVGIVDADDVLGSERVLEGDVVIAMASSGLHSNGYSLARHVLLQAARLPLDADLEELDGTLGEVLLTPTKIYAKDCLALAREVEVHAFSHVTGGGLASNLSRVLPEGLDATLERATWSLPAIVRLIAERGRVDQAEMERTFNMGVGMVAVVAAADADRALAVLMGRHVPAWVAGTVVRGSGSGGVARLHGAYQSA
ncbi:MAG: phosphoribosylformylglycinamidine cyclo-ligase [Frankiales bacterium]|jgi:phosphoribosylformylglycinamidine cyclo-ligase|nr:phosphoribosylformylglycinamidine cyclo-ligase [Frankiales bacterium]